MPFNLEQFMTENGWLILLLAAWSLVWKSFALWRAAGRREKKWFIILLILNTAGILEIIYLFFIARDDAGDLPSSPVTPLPPTAI